MKLLKKQLHDNVFMYFNGLDGFDDLTVWNTVQKPCQTRFWRGIQLMIEGHLNETS